MTSDPELRISRVESQSGYLENKLECPHVLKEDVKSSSDGKLYVMGTQRKEKSESLKQRWSVGSDLHTDSRWPPLPDPVGREGSTASVPAEYAVIHRLQRR